MKIVLSLFFACSLLVISPAHAFDNNSFYFGVGYYSQNFLNSISTKEDGSKGLMGEASYPLNFKYDYNFVSDWFLAAQLSYTPLSRKDPGDTSKVTYMHISMPFGKNLGSNVSSGFDWYLGPGFTNYQIKGSGGITSMNNGNSYNDFAVPGRSASINKITFDVGTSFNYEHSRFGFDLIIENPMSSKKRAQSMMLSYDYRFSGGLY